MKRIEKIRIFYQENKKALYTYALSLTRNRESAEDAMHTAFCKLLNRPMLPISLRPYVFRCVRNAAIDDWRGREASKEALFDLEAPSMLPEDRALWNQIGELLFELSGDERETIILKALHEFTFQEIATLRRTPIRTVISWYRRGLEKLKNMIGEEVK
ncbi:MAG: sigma-70 family RNA polymerase sigma factor [Desulfobacteraceae bacterium]|nr:MAG: sigma-70 family RNA polymerase sigma factor [Desulfobacteraceae bacterium]